MLVSVVTPAWHAEETLGAAVESLLAQSHDDWELIIAADDGWDYLSWLADRGCLDPRISCTPTPRPRSGPAAARNHALARARGAVVANLDADDSFAPDRLEKLAPLAAEGGASVDAVAVIDGRDKAINSGFPLGGTSRDLRAEDILACGVPLHSLFRRDLLPAGWPAVTFCEDVVINLELASLATRFTLLPEPLYRYQVREGSICHAPGSAVAAEAAYGEVIECLRAGGYRMTPKIRAAALEGFKVRRATNAAFAAAQKAGLAANFQDFIAKQDS